MTCASILTVAGRAFSVKVSVTRPKQRVRQQYLCWVLLPGMLRFSLSIAPGIILDFYGGIGRLPFPRIRLHNSLPRFLLLPKGLLSLEFFPNLKLNSLCEHLRLILAAVNSIDRK